MVVRLIVSVMLLCSGLPMLSYGQGRSECTKQEKLDFLRKGYTAEEIRQVCESILSSGGGVQCCCQKERVRYKAPTVVSYEWVAADSCLAQANTAIIIYQCVQPSFCAR
jgi:hypothetical protein